MSKQDVQSSNKNGLRDVQNGCLAILEKVIEICEKHNLRYYLAYGTLLGAVRHGGFIPWDDDIDIWMPRSDHERFIEIAESELGSYTLNYYSKHNDAFFRYKPLLSIEDHSIKVGFELDGVIKEGYIWIDIIAMDGMPSNEFIRKFHCRKFWMWYAIIGFSRSNRTGVLFYDKQSTLKKIGITINRVTHIGNLLNPDSCIDSFKKLKMRYDFDKSQYIHGSTNAYVEKCVFPKKWFDGCRKIEFEGISVSIPKETEKVLTQLYGDYMTLPPLEKRNQLHYQVIND